MVRRLGHILIEEGLITPVQREEALRNQTLFGGKIGTNLVEIGALQLDALARALGKQRGFPPALQKHFDQIHGEAVALVPAQLALKHHAIPLGFTNRNPKTLAVAFMDPTQVAAIDEIRFAAGARILVTIAPELRIMLYLEKLYGIARPVRYLRLEGSTEAQGKWGVAPAPRTEAPPLVLTNPISEGMPLRALSSTGSLTYAADMGPLATPYDDGENDTAGSSHPEDSSAGASWMTATSESTDPYGFDARLQKRPGNEPTSEPVIFPAIEELSATPDSAVLSPLRQSLASQENDFLTPDRVDSWPAMDVEQAVDTIASATSRDQIGDALLDYLHSTLDIGLLFIVQHDVALGWKGFAPNVDTSVLQSLSIPLTTPNVLRTAYENRSIFRGAPPSKTSALDAHLWKQIRSDRPREVVVAPVILRDRVVNLIYGQTADGSPVPDSVLVHLATLCPCAAAGFVRLIQLAKSKEP